MSKKKATSKPGAVVELFGRLRVEMFAGAREPYSLRERLAEGTLPDGSRYEVFADLFSHQVQLERPDRATRKVSLYDLVEAMYYAEEDGVKGETS